MDITMVRHLVTAVALFVIILVVDRSLLRARPRDVLLFALFGAFKLMSDVTLFKSQMLIDLSLSTLLQMTAPYYVMVFSLFLFKERITIQKMMTVIVAFIGCILVTGIVTGKHDDLNFVGIACACMSGLFFGMFTLGCKIGADRQYAPMTTMFYIFLFATLFSLPLADDAMVLRSFANAEMLLYILVLGFVLSLLPFYCTTWGVKRLEVTKASLISVMELVTAAIVGAAVFGEELSAPEDRRNVPGDPVHRHHGCQDLGEDQGTSQVERRIGGRTYLTVKYRKNNRQLRTHGLGVMTSPSHGGGRRFKSGWVHFSLIYYSGPNNVSLRPKLRLI